MQGLMGTEVDRHSKLESRVAAEVPDVGAEAPPEESSMFLDFDFREDILPQTPVGWFGQPTSPVSGRVVA